VIYHDPATALDDLSAIQPMKLMNYRHGTGSHTGAFPGGMSSASVYLAAVWRDHVNDK